MKPYFYKLLCGTVVAIYISSMILPGVARAVPSQAGMPQLPAKHEPKRGTNPETGKLSFLGNGDPIFVPGVSDVKGMSPEERARGMVNAYGKEFGLKNSSEELKLLKSQKDNNGKDVARFQQIYKGVPVLAGEMIVNTNANGELLSISGEVLSDLTLDTKPIIPQQEAQRIALAEIAKLHNITGTQLASTKPELWIFDASLLTASRRPVELVWRVEVTAKDAAQPIRELMLVNAQTGKVTWHINQVDDQTTTWPVYFDLALDEARGWIYGSDSTGNKIDVISMSTLTLVKSFTLVNGSTPKGLALSPDGSELAVAQYGASSILFLNPDTGATIATVIPNTTYTKAPWDVIYGRTGRLYSTGASDYYVHVIDTVTHLEVNRSPLNFSLSVARLAISADKNWLYASRSSGSPLKLYKYDISTDTLPEPTSTAHTSNFSGSTFILDTVDNLIFTDTGQVWTPDLKGNIGSTGTLGQVAYIPSHDAIAIASSSTNSVVFASAQNFYTLSTYSVQGPMGPIISQSDGNRVFVSTNSGIVSIDLTNFPPGTSVALPAGTLPYFDVIVDEFRGVLYGSNTTGHKIDVISLTTLQVLDQIRFNNGARPQGMDLSPDGGELAVALNGASSLAFINTATRSISATVIPNLDGAIMPFDVKYGRAGRLYSSGTGGLDYLHVFDTTTHTEVGISAYPNAISSSPYLAISADKNSVYANESSSVVRLFNVSTDSPVISTNTDSSYRGTNSLLLTDNTKLFSNSGQVWVSSLLAQIGSFNASGNLVEIPGQNLVAVLSSSTPGLITFVRTADFYTASTASIPSVSAVGASAVSSAGDKLYVNTNSGIKLLDISLSNPTSIAVSRGSSQSVQVGTQFQQPLEVKVQNMAGSAMPGVSVTFTAPATGASGIFADTNSTVTTALTNSDGIATSSMFMANTTAGSYTVKATISNLASSADFRLTNLAAVTCTISTGTDPNTLFLAYRLFNCGKTSHGVAAGDFNHDGRKDVALSASGTLLIFLQDDSGNLLQPRVYAGSSNYLGVGDLNGDGWDDIVSVDSSNTIAVFLQRNDGTLAYRVTYPTGTTPDAIAVGDVNNDGRKDVVVSHWNSAFIGVFTQNPNGTLNSMVSYPSVTAGYDDIAIGDVNNDGRNDVVKMNGQLYANPNLQVYLQNTNGTLGTAIPYSLGCSCLGSGIGIGDVTGDGRSDVVMSYGGNRPDAKLAVFAQDLNGNLQSAISYAAYDIPKPVEIADVNSDNLLDAVTLHSAWGRAGTFFQQQDGTLGSESLYVLPYVNSSYNPQDLSISDINNDSLPDLLISNYVGLVVLYRNTVIPPTPTPTNTPGPTFTPSPTFTSGPGPTPTPRPTSTPGPTPTPVPPSSTGSRKTYSAGGGSSLPGTFLCDQNQSICTNGADLDADAAHKYGADTFVFYNTHHHRNSIDDAGNTITSTVNYGIGYQNAFWNGSQVVFGDNMAADDVVGHEITHGVTQYTSGLIYSYQSGAINESFSDVWGEFIDQTNSSGNDSTAVKWLLGEDSALGVIRSMINPPTYGHPDKMSSPYYYTGSGDNGGVHINSGVNNKAAYLMVQGDTFNGRTILGIGLNKTAAVYYETQIYHLTTGANYNDLYYALNQACQNLIGGVDGITQNDCNQVRLAAEAVEMVPVPPSTPTPTATFTPSNTPTNTATFTPTFTPTATPPYSYYPLYLSFTGSQTIGGVSSADEDILKFDGTNWSLFFDGSDVGLGSTDLFAFALLDPDSLLMSFSSAVTVNAISATPQDVLRFDATSLGSNTAGTFSMYFDGSDVGFDTSGESIDSLSLLPDGRLLFSTTGSPSVTGVTGGRDEDVLAFTPTSLGDVTAGTWKMYFDGSDVGLADSSGEDVDALDVANGNIYLSTVGDFAVPGLTGADEDVFICVPTSTGDTTACSYSPTLYFDGSTWNLAANDVDAFNYLTVVPVPTATASPTPTNTPSSTFTPSPTNTSTRTPTSTATKTFTPTITGTLTPTTTPTNTATSTPVSPLTLTVNSTLDAVDTNPGDGWCETALGNNICTLRAAVQETNARATADTIILPAGTYTLTIPGALEEASASGDLNIAGDLTINGAGINTTSIDGNGGVLADRVFFIMGAYTVNMSDLTIQDGNPGANNGGGIYNWGGTLTLNRVVLRNNIAGTGGALFNRGPALLTDSSVYNNSTAYGAGGISNDRTMTIVGSTISGNSTNNDGGGIYSSGELTLKNSTISGNQAARSGGAIHIGYSEVGQPSAAVNLNNVTITNNIADSNNDGSGHGGGIYMVDTASVSFSNTILAGNSKPSGSSDCYGTLTSGGYNVIKSTSTCIVTGDTTGNLTGQNLNLGPLQDNGGLTTTHALLSNSSAIDAGNNATCESTDQRGVARPQGAHCDIGAFESVSLITPTATPTATGNATPTGTSTPTSTLTPTPTAPGYDVIFKDGFESGIFSAWSASVTNGGNLSVSSGSALVGNYGLQAAFTNTTGMYVRDDSPNAETRYRARFYFNPNSITMASGDNITLLQGLDPTGQVLFSAQFYRSSAGYQLRARAYDSGLANFVNIPYVNITNAVHYVEVDWGNDGHLTFWIDGVQQGSLTGLNTSLYTVDKVRLGAPTMTITGTSGSFYIDGFESRRSSYIGP